MLGDATMRNHRIDDRRDQGDARHTTRLACDHGPSQHPAHRVADHGERRTRPEDVVDRAAEPVHVFGQTAGAVQRRGAAVPGQIEVDALRPLREIPVQHHQRPMVDAHAVREDDREALPLRDHIRLRFQRLSFIARGRTALLHHPVPGRRLCSAARSRRSPQTNATERDRPPSCGVRQMESRGSDLKGQRRHLMRMSLLPLTK